MDKTCLTFIQNYVPEAKVYDSFFDAVKSGVNLCKLVNSLQQGAIQKIDERKNPFVYGANHQQFLNYLLSLKMPSCVQYTTQNLVQGNEQAISSCISCLVALASHFSIDIEKKPVDKLQLIKESVFADQTAEQEEIMRKQQQILAKQQEIEQKQREAESKDIDLQKEQMKLEMEKMQRELEKQQEILRVKEDALRQKESEQKEKELLIQQQKEKILKETEDEKQKRLAEIEAEKQRVEEEKQKIEEEKQRIQRQKEEQEKQSKLEAERAEQERLAKLEAEKAEQERLAKLEAEKVEQMEQEKENEANEKNEKSDEQVPEAKTEQKDEVSPTNIKKSLSFSNNVSQQYDKITFEEPSRFLKTYKCNIGILGAEKVGKSALCQRFQSGEYLENAQKCEYYFRKFAHFVNEQPANVELNLKITEDIQYLKDCQFVIIMFAHDDPKSFKALSKLIKLAEKAKVNDIIIVGNKADLRSDKGVKIDDIEKFVDKTKKKSDKMKYVSVSCLKGFGIKQLVDSMEFRTTQ